MGTIVEDAMKKKGGSKLFHFTGIIDRYTSVTIFPLTSQELLQVLEGDTCKMTIVTNHIGAQVTQDHLNDGD